MRKYIKSEALKQLETEATAYKRKYNPDAKKVQFSDKTAPCLEKAIKSYIYLRGWQCEKVQSMGRTIYKDNKAIFVRNNWQTGTADLSATVAGKSVKIEVKCKWTGDHYQSGAQKKYQRRIEKAGGIYFIARTFEQFQKWFDNYLITENVMP